MKKKLKSLVFVIIIVALIYFKITFNLKNQFLEYGNDILIVIPLLVFAEQILLFILYTPLIIYKKIAS